MVQTLNLILLTAPELSPLRTSLKNCFQPSATDADRQVFITLFSCWSHNPVATFSLCLLAQAYDLSSCLVFKFADVDVTVGFLMQVDKLVQLLESPIFIHLRLHLLDVNTKNHAELIKSLYGLLMLLPQSLAYKTLSDRLATVSSMQMNLGFSGRMLEGGSTDKADHKPKAIANSAKPSAIDYQKLLTRFETVQQAHSTFRAALLREKSLLSSTTMSS